MVLCIRYGRVVSRNLWELSSQWFRCFPTFSSWTNLKWHNTHVTSMLINQVIADLDSSVVSGPDYFFSGDSEERWTWIFMHSDWSFQKDLHCHIVGKSNLCYMYWNMLGDKSVGKNCCSVNNGLVGDYDKCGLFSDIFINAQVFL